MIKQLKVKKQNEASAKIRLILILLLTHVIVDVVAGMLLAEFGYMISGIITGEENEQSNVGVPEAR